MNFDSFKLNEESVSMIVEVDTSFYDVQEDNPCNSLLCKLIDECKIENERNMKQQEINLQNDCLELDEMNDISDTESNYCLEHDEMNDISDTESNIGQSDIAEIENIRCQDIENLNSTDVQGKINTENEENLIPMEEGVQCYEENIEKYEDIIEIWNNQCTLNGRQKFIKDFSVNKTSIDILSTRILVPWLRSTETFSEAVETLIGVIMDLPLDCIFSIFIPLLKEKESLLINESQCARDLISSMTDQQKNELLCLYLNDIESHLDDYHINVVYTLAENAILSKKCIQRLLDCFTKGLKKIDNNRYFGNTLLLIAQKLSTDTPQDIIKQMVLLCNQFKGVMRFRIKSILKSISSEVL